MTTGSVGSIWFRIGAATLLGLIAAGFVAAVGLQPPRQDIHLDWLSAKGAVHSDAYASMFDLADEFGVSIEMPIPVGTSSAVHPRTPGAILLQLPLLAIGFDRLFPFATASSVAALALLLMFALSGRGPAAVLAGVIFATITIPFLMTVLYATQSAFVALLVLGGWGLISMGRPRMGGGLVGIAVVLKVFPAILIIPLLVRKQYQAVGSILATGMLLTVGGLALPGVSISGAIAALSAASTHWETLSANAGLITLLGPLDLTRAATWAVLALIGLGLALILLRIGERGRSDPLPWILIGLLVSPLSWAHYDVVLVPAVVALLVARPDAPTFTVTLPALWVLPTILLLFGQVHPGPWFLWSRLLLLLIWLIGVLSLRPSERGIRWQPTGRGGRTNAVVGPEVANI